MGLIFFNGKRKERSRNTLRRKHRSPFQDQTIWNNSNALELRKNDFRQNAETDKGLSKDGNKRGAVKR